MRAPLVSVVIPSWNSARFVVEAVESALAQTYTSVEVVVVDDGSTDNTRLLLEPYRPRIRYVYQPNAGLSAARNRGIRESTGRYVAFLDADDKWLPQKLERQMAVFAREPEVGLVHSEVLHLDDQTGRRFVQEAPNSPFRHEFVGKCAAKLFVRNGLIVSSVVLRRECIDRAGAFDEAITKPTVQDYDLWLRVARHFHFGFVQEALVLYRLHGSNASSNALMMSEDQLRLLRRTLREDPSLWEAVGGARARERLFRLEFDLAYRHFLAGRRTLARRHFRRAVCLRPAHLRSYMLWSGSWLPAGTLQAIRAWRASRRRESVAVGELEARLT